jgi:hypothetical protein
MLVNVLPVPIKLDQIKYDMKANRNPKTTETVYEIPFPKLKAKLFHSFPLPTDKPNPTKTKSETNSKTKT